MLVFHAYEKPSNSENKTATFYLMTVASNCLHHNQN